MILWSLLVGFLVGLGLILNAWLSPQPRCIIPTPHQVQVEFLSDNGNTILTRDEDFGIYQTWDTYSGQNHGTYVVEGPGIHAISPCGRFLAILGQKGKLHLVDLKLAKESKIILNFSGGSPRLTFSSHGTFLLAHKSENDEIRALCPNRVALGDLVECSTGGLVKTLGDLTFFRFLRDENLLFCMAPAGRLGSDGILTHWDTGTGKTIRTFKDFDAIDLSPDGRTLLAQSVENGLFLFDLVTEKVQQLHPPPVLYSQYPSRSAFSPNGKTLITFPETLPDSEIIFWDVASGKRRGGGKRPDSPSGKIPGFFSADSAFFVLANPGLPAGRLSLWETATGGCLWKRFWEVDWREFGSEIRFPADIRFAGEGQFLFVPRNGRFEILDVKTGETKNVLEPPSLGERQIEFTKDRTYHSLRTLADQGPGFLHKLFGDWWPANTKENDMKVTVVETATGRIVSQLQGPYGNGNLSNDGRTMVTGYREPDGKLSLRCWDLPLRPPMRLVVGIPLGIGLLFVLASWWRGRRRAKKLPA